MQIISESLYSANVRLSARHRHERPRSCLLKNHAGMWWDLIFFFLTHYSQTQAVQSGFFVVFFFFFLNFTQTIHISTKAIVRESFLIKVRIVTVTNWINSNFAPCVWQDSIMLTGSLSANCIMTWCLHVHFPQQPFETHGTGVAKWLIAVEETICCIVNIISTAPIKRKGLNALHLLHHHVLHRVQELSNIFVQRFIIEESSHLNYLISSS